MDLRAQPIYQDPRMSMMEQSYIDSVPDAIPINNTIDNNAQRIIEMQDAHMPDYHPAFIHKTHLSTMPEQQNYSQLPIRKEVDDEGRILGVVLPENYVQHYSEENSSGEVSQDVVLAENLTDHSNEGNSTLPREFAQDLVIPEPPAHHSNDGNSPVPQEVSQDEVLQETPALHPKEENNSLAEVVTKEEIKTEEEDYSYFMESAHDTFLKISSKELTIKAAADLLGRPYSFTYRRYQEFCDNITGVSGGSDAEEEEEEPKKKKKSGKKRGKYRRAKKMNWGANKPKKNTKLFKCEECPGTFSTDYLCKQHQKTHEEESEDYHTCSVCDLAFPKITQLMTHRIESHEEALQCPHCDMTFTVILSYRTHVRSHLGENPFVCKECGKGYKIKTHLEEHIRTHTGERPFMCGFCEKAFYTMSHLKGHVNKVHNNPNKIYKKKDPSEQKEKKFECEVCGRRYEYSSALNEHMNIHTGAKPYACDFCDARFNFKTALHQHRMKHTGEQPKKRILGPPGPRIKKKKFECDECGRKYTSQSSLIQHKNVHTGAMPYACTMCDARFNFRQLLKNHEMTHTGIEPYKCEVCPATFYKKKGLEQHTLIHTGIKPFKCDLCDYACTRKESLEYHRNTHTGETPFKCDFYGCTAEYPKPGSLRKHKLQHGQPPKTCKLCGEKFQDAISLKRHMMIHTGEKPVACEQCSKVFYDKASLKRHMWSHMEKPPGSKPKPIRQNRKNPVVKKPVIAPVNITPVNITPVNITSQKIWESEYQIPIAENGQNIFAQPLTTTVQNTNNQPTFHHFSPGQYTTIVNNTWPTAMNPDELRHRLLNSFK